MRPDQNPHLAETCDQAADDKAAELVRILDQHLAELKAGHAPSRTELIGRHPALASQLEACLAGLEFIHGAEAAPGRTQRLGDFRIIREVGRGGMGAVFEADQISLGRRVALKILRFGGVSDPEAIERFKREAETVAKLHHTNIVPIFAVGSERGVNYYAMQFIDGQSLAEVLAEKKQPLLSEQVAEWGLQAAEALTHAHQRGVIHRDVKPSNLLLDKENRLWLTDFGLARRMDDVTLSLTGALLGTPRYMSPEQAGASAKRVDHRSDLFSLGATLYELLTGQPSFPGETPHDVINCILTCEPTPIRQIVKTVPRDLETIVMKCLAKEPGQRYSAARDLADDLRAFLDGRPIRARRASLVELARRWIKSQQRSARLMATAAALTLAVTLLGVFGWSGFDAWRQGSIQFTTPSPPLVAEIIDPDGDVVRRETIPTQEPVSLPAGEYQVRASSEGSLSQTFDVEIERGNEVKYAVDLRDVHYLSRDIDRTYAYVDLGRDKLSLVLLGNAGISLHGEMPPPIRPDVSPLKEVAGFRWPWSQGSDSYSGFGLFDLRPWVAPQGFDLNGDGARDVICAGRHQAWLMAVSGKDGTLLWFSPKGEDLKTAPTNRWLIPLTSAVLGEPIVDRDCDGDGVNDVIATLADVGSNMVRMAGDQIAARCWVEALSGKTGQTIWSYELSPKWFELPPGAEVPYQCRWFAGSGSGVSSHGGGWARSGRQVYRRAGQVERIGTHAYRPEAARPINLGNHAPLAVVAGSRVALIDPKTGKETQPPQELTARPARPPQFGDMDGDGAADLILLSERPVKSTSDIPAARLVVWSLARQKALWSKDLDARWPVTHAWTIVPPQWPLVADLNGDGKCEVIAPDGSSGSGQSYFGSHMGIPWGRLIALDGVGNELWTRRLATMDQQVEQLEAGPDIDGDGWREVYAVTLSGPDYRIYVDALCGRSGKTLWTATGAAASTERGPHLAPPKWWMAGEDGWPQLVVQAADDSRGARQSVVCTFSAGTGRMTHVGRGIAEVQPRDIDRDGTDDLLVFDALPPENMLDFGGKLHVVRGVAAEPWRRIGDVGEPAADLDGDGVAELISRYADGTVQARSGRNGKQLWRNKLGRGTGQTGLCLANHDLDGDGTPDFLAWTDTYGPRRKSYPFHALSGRTGKALWNAQQFDVHHMSNIVSATSADLDHDGKPEAIWLAGTDHDFPQRDSWSSHDFQLWLLVTSGQTGATRWAQPLSPAFGLTGGSTVQVQLSERRVMPSVADLDQDGIDDLIVPGIAADGRNIETRAVSGKDGRELWRRPFPPNPSHSPPGMERWVPPLVADLSGDGSRQAILVEFGSPDNPPAGALPVLRVIAVDAKEGKPRWSWGSAATAGSWSQSAGPVSEGELLRPVLLRAANGGKRVAVSIPGSRAQVVVFGAEGKLHERAPEYQSQRSLLFPCDADGDGIDELAFVDKSVLLVAPADKLDQPLWTYDAKSAGGVRILGLLPPSAGSLSPSIALLGDPVDNSLLGLDAATGKVVWSCPGPIPRTEEGHYQTVNQLALLGSKSSEPPFVYYAYGFVARCRQAAFVGRGAEPGDDPALASLAVRGVAAAPPRIEMAADDPRWRRNLPWVQEHFSWRNGVTFAAWAMAFATLLVVVPAGYVLRLIWLRRFGMKTLLTLPVIAALFLAGALASAPADNDFDTLLGRLSIGVMFAPAVVGVGLLGWWMISGQWRRAALWLGITVVLAAACAAIALRHDQQWKPLVAGESYDVTGWYQIWFAGAFATSCLAIVVLPLKYAAVKAWRWWRQARDTKAKVEAAGAATLAAQPTEAPRREALTEPSK